MADITIKGLEELRRNLDEFSDRRFAAAVATAMSRSAVLVRDKMRKQMAVELDRPTPYTLNSLYTVPAKAEKLEAKVRFKDDRATSGTPATYYMMPNVKGGARRAKGLERNLQTVGILPADWFVVPGQGATLDKFGNVSRGQIIQVLSQLRITLLAGSTRNMRFDKDSIAAQRKAGGRYFVIPVGSRGAQPGIYQREFLGKQITPVFIFVRGAKYRKRFAFYEQGEKWAGEFMQQELQRSINDHIDRLARR